MGVAMLQSIIYYTVRSPKLDHWLTSPSIQEALSHTMDRSYVDLDPTFNQVSSQLAIEHLGNPIQAYMQQSLCFTTCL